MSPLEFDPQTHTYRVGGRALPSVTQILKPLVDFTGIPPSVLENKRQIGTLLHAATDLDDEQALDEASVDDAVRGYLEGYRRWRQESGAVILMREQRVWHGIHRYAGTLDLLADVDDHEWIVDLKTSYDIHPAVGPQTAAYEQALNFGRPLRRAVLQLKPDGRYVWRELPSPRDWIVFQACLLIHRFQEEHRNG